MFDCVNDGKFTQDAPKSLVTNVYNEALSLMEQSVSIDNPQYAQECLRQQLESLSNKLLGIDDEVESGK